MSVLGLREMAAALGRLRASLAPRELSPRVVAAMDHLRRYPDWRSLVKTRGRRDASLRSRSNRRKAATRSK